MSKISIAEDAEGVEKDDEEQSRRFIEAAESLQADKNGKKFKGALGLIKKSIEIKD